MKSIFSLYDMCKMEIKELDQMIFILDRSFKPNDKEDLSHFEDPILLKKSVEI